MADVVAVAVAIVLATLMTARDLDWSVSQMVRYAAAGLLTLPVWPFLFARQKMYAARFVTRLFDELRRAAGAMCLGATALIAVGWVLDLPVSRFWVLALTLNGMWLLGVERYVARRYFRRRREAGRSLRRVVIVGTNAEARDLARSLEARSLGYEVVGFVVDDGAPVTVSTFPSTGSQGTRWRSPGRWAPRASSSPRRRSTWDCHDRSCVNCSADGLHVELTSGLRDITPERMTIHPLGRHPVVYLEPTRRVGWRAIAKRVFDVVVALLGLIVASPVLLGSALAVKLTSNGPASVPPGAHRSQR